MGRRRWAIMAYSMQVEAKHWNIQHCAQKDGYVRRPWRTSGLLSFIKTHVPFRLQGAPWVCGQYSRCVGILENLPIILCSRVSVTGCVCVRKRAFVCVLTMGCLDGGTRHGNKLYTTWTVGCLVTFPTHHPNFHSLICLHARQGTPLLLHMQHRRHPRRPRGDTTGS